MGPAERAYGRVEALGLVEVADVPATRDHDELSVGDGLLELTGDGQGRTSIELAPR